jgi:predicted acyl esterase
LRKISRWLLQMEFKIEDVVKASSKMIIERDVPIRMDDGVVLRADVFRPKNVTRVPVLMNLGPYGKGIPFQQDHANYWKELIEEHPEILEGSTGSLLTYETADPERWVQFGYALVRVDSRGAGRSPGYLEIFSPRESRDYYDCIEWAASQPWSTGKVGLLGISYYSMNQWNVASLQPPHLAAMVTWEGASDHYRETTHHGGILSGFLQYWYPPGILTKQHGVGTAGEWDPWLDEPAMGPETLDEDQLKANHEDYIGNSRSHNLDDDYHKSRSAIFDKIKIPLLSAANWGGIGLHSRGNFEGFVQAASKQKWLEVHTGSHVENFYLQDGVDIQRRFLDHFLKEIDNGWDKEPPVILTIRHADKIVQRKEHEWPLARTKWTRIYLDLKNNALTWTRPTEVENESSFRAEDDGLTFTSSPLTNATEITGPLSAKLFVSSSTTDADLFLTLRGFHPDGKEIAFRGAGDPRMPLSQGWLRASHRKLDLSKSKPYRPYHSHDQLEKLEPRNIYELDVEIWPTCVVLPSGSRIAITVAGHDFTWPGTKGVGKWSGPFLHNDHLDRPPSEFQGKTGIHSGTDRLPFVLLPIIPDRTQ